MSIKIELELEELNGVMVALGNMPYAQVQPLIDKIRQQAIPQVQQDSEIPVAVEDSADVA